MNSISRAALVVATAVILSGCAAQTFHINGSVGEYPTDQQSQTFFISGIGQHQTTDAAKICGGVENIIKVETQRTFLNGLLALLTFWIYTPRDAKVYCKQG